MPFTGKKTGGRIHAHPACTGNIDLGPGMQIGKINFRAGRSIQRLDILLQLHQIPGDKTGGKAERSRILTSSQAESRHDPLLRRQRLLTALHIWFHADQIADVTAQLHIQTQQENRWSAWVGSRFLPGNHSIPFPVFREPDRGQDQL